jgi:hypothetical protein
MRYFRFGHDPLKPLSGEKNVYRIKLLRASMGGPGATRPSWSTNFLKVWITMADHKKPVLGARLCISHRWWQRLLLVGALLWLAGVQVEAGALPGYTLHFNFIDSELAARETVGLAAQGGAKVVSLVPPAHIWADGASQKALDAAIAEAKRRNLQIIFSRLDATQSNGQAWLYQNALHQPGRLPDGSPSVEWFCATIGNHRFEHWQRQETLYYARRYGKLRQLMGIAVGGMVEPFVSQRGSLLQWDQANGSYAIAQYTPEGLAEWHRWLRRRFKGINGANRAYRSNFPSIAKVPMPQNANDPQFGRPREAYFDFAQSLNDWFLQQYRENRRIWRRYSSAPFLLQLSGFASEKIAKGHPEFAAFDLPGWVSEADALGMSLYTNAGYEDWGHTADAAILQLLASAGDNGKQTFVMESGCEAPEVTLAPHELSFALRMGAALDPVAYVYEYFRYQRDDRVDPGIMVSPRGAVQEPAFVAVAREMSELSSLGHAISQPCFVYLAAPLTARRNELAGRLNRAVYQLANHVPCRMLPWRKFDRVAPKMVVLAPPDLQHVVPPAQLQALMRRAKHSNWCLVSDAPTCAALGRMQPSVRLAPLALDRLVTENYVEDEAAVLHEELSTLAEYQQRVAAQPLEPRPGLSWLEVDGRLLLWVEDDQPVVGHLEALRERRVEYFWCSTRSGGPVELIFGDASQGEAEVRRPLLSRRWQPLSELHADTP